MLATVAIVAATLFLAYANGANDNFKGVATLYGSGAMSYRHALIWATITTLAGSLGAILLAGHLVHLFSGKVLVPDALTRSPAFLGAVAFGAGGAVMLAARLGIPISTTHALIGGLSGAGLVGAFDQFNAAHLGHSFLYPLAVAPLIPALLIGLVYPVVRAVVLAALGRGPLAGWRAPLPVAQAALPFAIPIDDTPSLHVPDTAQAASQRVALITKIMAGLHILSAGAIGFARGLNDAPKIVAIIMVAGIFSLHANLVAIALAMAAGGLWRARPIGETMARKITPLGPGQGTLANVITSLLVLFASNFGVPVSTTHVSVGALFGVGITQRALNWPMLGGIVSAWVITLPAAMAGSALCYLALSHYL